MSARQYLEEEVDPVLKPLLRALVQERPNGATNILQTLAKLAAAQEPKSYLMCGTPTSICGSGVLTPSNRSCKTPAFVIWGLAFAVCTPSASSRGRLCSRVFGAAWSGAAHAALT